MHVDAQRETVNHNLSPIIITHVLELIDWNVFGRLI